MMLFVFMQSPHPAVGIFLSSIPTRGIRIKGALSIWLKVPVTKTPALFCVYS